VAAGVDQLGVAARHGDVVEEDLAVGVTTDGDAIGVERVPRPEVGAAGDDQQTLRLGELRPVERELVDHLDDLVRERVGARVGVERVAARGAELGPLLVLVAARAAQWTPAGHVSRR
jgi:hypothetical protein